MSEKKFETVSSCVDDVIIHDESIDEIIKDKELSDTWGRYQLMGDIMRNDVPQTLQLDLSAKIAAAIDDEPTVLAPKNTAKSESSFKARIINFVKPLGQVAIAASAAGLMVLGVQQNNVSQTNDIAPMQNIQTNPLIGIAEPVSFNYQQPTQMSKKQAYIQQQRRLQALLFDHKQQIKLTAINTAEIKKANSPVIIPLKDKVENLPK